MRNINENETVQWNNFLPWFYVGILFVVVLCIIAFNYVNYEQLCCTEMAIQNNSIGEGPLSDGGEIENSFLFFRIAFALMTGLLAMNTAYVALLYFQIKLDVKKKYLILFGIFFFSILLGFVPVVIGEDLVSFGDYYLLLFSQFLGLFSFVVFFMFLIMSLMKKLPKYVLLYTFFNLIFFLIDFTIGIYVFLLTFD